MSATAPGGQCCHYALGYNYIFKGFYNVRLKFLFLKYTQINIWFSTSFIRANIKFLSFFFTYLPMQAELDLRNKSSWAYKIRFDFAIVEPAVVGNVLLLFNISRDFEFWFFWKGVLRLEDQCHLISTFYKRPYHLCFEYQYWPPPLTVPRFFGFFFDSTFPQLYILWVNINGHPRIIGKTWLKTSFVGLVITSVILNHFMKSLIFVFQWKDVLN